MIGRRIAGRLVAIAAALVVALALTSCAGLPTAGPVNLGQLGGSDAESPDFVLKPDSPQPGATPQQIVEGFLRAGSGPANRWAVAKEYLTPEAADVWKPTNGVTIDSGDRAFGSLVDDDMSVTLTQTAGIDASGAYTPTETGSSTTLDFRLTQQSGGEWRISKAPDGIVLNENVFPNVFRRYSLMFFDPTWTYLVPDLRWYPTVNAASRITTGVFGGPSPWLAASVKSAVPTSSTAPAAVPVVSTVAQIDLGSSAGGVDRTTLDRLQTQLAASLAAAGVTEVDLTADGTALESSRVSTASTNVNAAPLVLTADGFGFLSGESLEPLPGLSDAIRALSSPPVAIQVDPSQTVAAARLTDGSVVRVSSERVGDADARAGLVDPSIDRYDWIWSVPRDTPTGLVAVGDAGAKVAIPGAWVGASAVTALSVSRDGTRLAALVESGGRTMVWVKGILRALDGTPTGLGEVTLEVGTAAGGGIGLAWLDDATLGVLTSGSGQPAMVEQPVGGPGTAVAAPAGVTAIAGANQVSTVRLRDAEGALYVKRGTNWNRTVGGVQVLATQQGSPAG